MLKVHSVLHWFWINALDINFFVFIRPEKLQSPSTTQFNCNFQNWGSRRWLCCTFNQTQCILTLHPKVTAAICCHSSEKGASLHNTHLIRNWYFKSKIESNWEWDGSSFDIESCHECDGRSSRIEYDSDKFKCFNRLMGSLSGFIDYWWSLTLEYIIQQQNHSSFHKHWKFIG